MTSTRSGQRRLAELRPRMQLAKPHVDTVEDDALVMESILQEVVDAVAREGLSLPGLVETNDLNKTMEEEDWLVGLGLSNADSSADSLDGLLLTLEQDSGESSGIHQDKNTSQGQMAATPPLTPWSATISTETHSNAKQIAPDWSALTSAVSDGMSLPPLFPMLPEPPRTSAALPMNPISPMNSMNAMAMKRQGSLEVFALSSPSIPQPRLDQQPQGTLPMNLIPPNITFSSPSSTRMLHPSMIPMPNIPPSFIDHIINDAVAKSKFKDSSGAKAYRCPRPRCGKVYRSVNSMRNHLRHGQCRNLPFLIEVPIIPDTPDEEKESDAMKRKPPDPPKPIQVLPVVRPYFCKVADCRKQYKNLNGLKYHARIHHPHLPFETEVKGYDKPSSEANASTESNHFMKK